MNAQIIEDILNQAKVDKNGRIMNKGRLNDMLHSEHLKAVKNSSTSFGCTYKFCEAFLNTKGVVNCTKCSKYDKKINNGNNN